MTVVLARLCTICMKRNIVAQAIYIAQNAEQHQWYECEEHGPLDHDREFGGGLRIVRESKDAFFERHFGKR